MENEEKALKGYEITRRAIESLETTIADNRKGFLTFIGIVGTVTVALLGLVNQGDIIISADQSEIVVTSVGAFGAAFIYIFWGLDVYYTSKLIVANKTAIRYEQLLQLCPTKECPDIRLGITNELENYSKKREFLPKFYHLIYAVPGFSIILIMSYLNKNGLENATLGGYAIICIYIAFSISLIAHWLVSDWSVSDFVESAKEQSSKYATISQLIRIFLSLFIFSMIIWSYPSLVDVTLNKKLSFLLDWVVIYATALIGIGLVIAYSPSIYSRMKEKMNQYKTKKK